MKKNCDICGIKLYDTKTYNPYNTTFKYYHHRERDGIYWCKKCAEKFVAQSNKCIGGRWVLEKIDEKAMPV